jgi:hypothetical protein
MPFVVSNIDPSELKKSIRVDRDCSVRKVVEAVGLKTVCRRYRRLYAGDRVKSRKPVLSSVPRIGGYCSCPTDRSNTKLGGSKDVITLNVNSLYTVRNSCHLYSGKCT